MEGKTIKQLREENNLNQEKASKELNINKNYLSMIECGTRNPSDKLKKKMAIIYKVTIYEIFLALETTKCNIQKNV